MRVSYEMTPDELEYIVRMIMDIMKNRPEHRVLD